MGWGVCAPQEAFITVPVGGVLWASSGWRPQGCCLTSPCAQEGLSTTKNYLASNAEVEKCWSKLADMKDEALNIEVEAETPILWPSDAKS